MQLLNYGVFFLFISIENTSEMVVVTHSSVEYYGSGTVFRVCYHKDENWTEPFCRAFLPISPPKINSCHINATTGSHLNFGDVICMYCDVETFLSSESLLRYRFDSKSVYLCDSTYLFGSQ